MAMARDDDYVIIPCQKCEADIGKPPVFSEFHIQMMKKRRGDFNLIQNRPRCLTCLKYLARDPSKVGEDEVVELKNCSGCELATYCSVGDCQEKHFLIHKWFCKPKCDFSTEELAWKYNSLTLTFDKYGRVVIKELTEQEEEELHLLHNLHHYVQGTLSMNYVLLNNFIKHNIYGIFMNDFVDPRAKYFKYRIFVKLAWMFLGNWDLSWYHVKSSLCINSQKRQNAKLFMTKHLEKCDLLDDIYQSFEKG